MVQLNLCLLSGRFGVFMPGKKKVVPTLVGTVDFHYHDEI